MSALPEGVDSGIRPAGAMHPQGLPEHIGESGLDPILDGVAARLALPARVAGTVVGNNKFEPPAAIGLGCR